MDERSLVFFDLDHTLVKVNSSFRFGVFLYRQGKLPFFSMLKLVGHYLQYKRGVVTQQELHTNVFQSFFCGASSSVIGASASQFWDRYFDALADKAMIERVLEVQGRGDIAVILSSSPDFLAKDFARRLNVDICHATPYIADAEGRFSSIPFVMDGLRKACFVRDLADEHQVPIDQTVGYSDSVDDRSFLEAVGTPIAVNPDRRLRQHALKCNWTII